MNLLSLYSRFDSSSGYQEKEWIKLPTMLEVALAQANKWEVERYIDGLSPRWVHWNGFNWNHSTKFRGKPK